MISYWGIGAACGVVVNDNLVLVDSINRLERERKTYFRMYCRIWCNSFQTNNYNLHNNICWINAYDVRAISSSKFLKPAVISLSFGVVLSSSVTLIFSPMPILDR